MNTCIVPGENHSTDLVSVYHGMTEPATACGYHAYYWPELVARAHNERANHRFEPSYTGMVCERMVMRDGSGDQCGLPIENHDQGEK